MNHATLFKVAAVVTGLFGLALLFAPNALNAVYGAPAMNGPGIYNSMAYGGVLIAFAVMNWQASGVTLQEARFVVLGNVVGDSIGFFSALSRQLVDPSIPGAAWFNVALFLVFALLFLRLQLRLGAPAASGGAG